MESVDPQTDNGFAMLYIAPILFIFIFSFALSLAPDALAIRSAVVFVLAVLLYAFARASAATPKEHEAPNALTSVGGTVFFQAVDYVLNLRLTHDDVLGGAAKDTSALDRYLLSPMKLLCNWRHLGLSSQVRKGAGVTRGSGTPGTSRLWFVVRRLLIAAACLAAIDFCDVNNQTSAVIEPRKQATLTRLGELSVGELALRALVCVESIISSIAGVLLAHSILSALAVGSWLSKPADWPRYFGYVKNAYCIRGCWGQFYHQGLRRAVSGPSNFVISTVFGISPGTATSKYLRLLLAFVFSGIIHGSAELASGVPLQECGQFFFFILQPLGILVEDQVERLHKRLGSPLPPLVGKGLGFLWVACWLLWTVPYWAYPMIRHSPEIGSQLRPLAESMFA